MANILYKTEANVSPHGKPRVWFCAHPADHAAYRDAVIQEILSAYKCAVYYYDDPMEPLTQAQLDEHLGQMNLFVMPVTTRLLKTSNYALDIEYVYAVKNHIPILPLMQESDLERLFNEKCGTRHFLDKHKIDPTALSYEEKLKQYLTTLFAGDAQAEQIRQAFDAYIFLSYRKKDRKYAQELMRLIHQNDFCRDVAIWYDEFLVPGEDFNDFIEKAMAQSNLFAMAVTPNLLEDGNYVMEVEYKKALAAKKVILPAEMLATDHAQLGNKFARIPDCTDAKDAAALRDALRSSFSSIALERNRDDPQHSFFIGLAYLSGIDVEVNHELALELIESAANSGLQEAMLKLVQIYRNGEGTEIDHQKAIEWQQKYITLLEKTLTGGEVSLGDCCFNGWVAGTVSKFDPSVLDAFLKGSFALGDYYREIRNLECAEKVYEKINSDLWQLRYAHVPFSTEELSYLIEMRQFEVHKERYNSRDPFLLNLLIKHAEESLAESDSVIALRYLAMAHTMHGDIYAQCLENASYGENLLSGKWRAFQKWVEFLKRIALVQIAYAVIKNAAKKDYEKSLHYAQSLVECEYTVTTLETQWNCQMKMGHLMTNAGHYQKALGYYQEAKDTIDQMDTLAASASCLYFAEINDALAQLQKKCPQLFSEGEYLQQALEYARAYDRQMHSVSSKRLLGTCYKNLGFAHFSKKQYSESETFLNQAIQIHQAIVEQTDNPKVKVEMVESCFILFDINMTKKGYDRANLHLKTAGKSILQLRDALYADNIVSYLLAVYWTKREKQEKHKGNRVAAKRARERARYYFLNNTDISYDSPRYQHKEIMDMISRAESRKGLIRFFLYGRARYMNQRLLWECPNVPQYEALQDELDRKFYFYANSKFLPICAVLVFTILHFLLEYRREVSAETDVIYWIGFVLCFFIGLWGWEGLFGRKVLTWSAKRRKKKIREKRGFFSEITGIMVIFACVFLVAISICVTLLLKIAL